MKKYLMTGVAALAFAATFTSCSSHDGFEYNAEQENIDAAQAYQKAFKERFGTIAPGHTWGFESAKAGTRGNVTNRVAETSTGINANANQWADPDEKFGGWSVPAALTDRQKLRVYRYFQTHPNLGYEDPEWPNFFVQQCYTGGTAQYGVSTENVKAANGSTYGSSEMNELSVGKNHQHINNFNGGGYGVENGENKGATGVDVLDNGEKVGGKTHKDQIMLMVNIDDTSCFGYKESGASVQRDDKMALVSAAEIDRWAANEGKDLKIDLGDPVVDDWNRSFLGFDHALYTKEEAYVKDWQTGKTVYATYDQAPGQPMYAWDGNSVFPIKENGQYLDAYKAMSVGWLDTNANFYIEAGKVSLSQTVNLDGGKISDQTWDNIKNYVVLDNAYYNDANPKVKVLNLKRINELIADGYLPINNKSLQEWVLFGDGDGYYTDWIVTLTEAIKPTKKTVAEEGRIICEDLGTSDDFDFNDIVFDATIYTDGTCDITILAAGGTLDITVAGEDIHSHTGKMTTKCNYALPTKTGYSHLIDIPIVVTTTNSAGEITSYELHCKAGAAPQKICVPKTYKWCTERTHIDDAYPEFKEWVKANNGMNWTNNPVAGKVVE